MIQRNVSIVMGKQRQAELGLTEKDIKTIEKKGVRGWVKSEFGVKDETELESVYQGIISAAPTFADIDKDRGKL